MAKSSGPSKDDVKNNVAGWDLVGFDSGSSSSGTKSGSAVSSSGGSSSSGSDNDSGGSSYNSGNGPDMSRRQDLAGQTVQQGRFSVSYDGLGYAKSGVKTSDSPGYVVDGVTYGGGSSSSGSTSASNTRYSSGASATDDYSQYLKDLYASQTASQLAALKSAYDQNTADLQAQATKIPQTYYAARNDAAAQNEIAKQSFNEYAASRGLNTGTSGQAALANSAALQKNLSTISTSEADALSENALAAQKLKAQYESAVNQAQASGNSQLAQALYQEYVRQTNAQTAAQAAAQEQSNWEKQYEAQQQQYQTQLQQYADSQNQWQQEFDYNKTSDAQSYANNLARTMLSMGVMPDSSTLAAAGISTSEALAMKLVALQSASAGTVTASSVQSSSGSKAKSSAAENAIENKNEIVRPSGDVTSFNFNDDDGVFTWAGNRYTSLESILSAMDKAGLTASEKEILVRKMKLFGINATFS